MKKFSLLFFVLSICAVLLLSSCKWHGGPFPDIAGNTLPEQPNYADSETQPSVCLEPGTDGTRPVTAASKPQSPVTAAPEPQSPETTVPEASAAASKTARGYDIVNVGGITYVDGIIIANKTYPLPKSYNPGGLTPECDRAFEELKAAARENGLTLWNQSGFRSYETQESIYNRYVDRDGKEEADTYSARPGHSEHQTGLAIDLNDISRSFANTPEGKWVGENAWRYGFILRYPRDKQAVTGYIYEPWHIRYVGRELADKIYHSGLCVEEYFGIDSAYRG